MIDGKSLAKAVIWHSIKTWSIPVILWLGAALYFSHRQEYGITEVILWSPVLLIILFQHSTSMHEIGNRARADADRDVDEIIANVRSKYPDRYQNRRKEIIAALLKAKNDLEDLGIFTMSLAIDRQVEKLREEIYEMERKKIA